MADRYIFTTEGHGTSLGFTVWRGEGAHFTDKIGKLTFSVRVTVEERRALIEAFAMSAAALCPETPLLEVRAWGGRKAAAE